MSRTRKDRPYRVRLNDKSEPKMRLHSHGSVGSVGTDFRGRDYRYADYCTIEERSLHSSNRDPMNRRPCETHLGWQYRPGRRPKREDALLAYWAPARQAERSALHSATAEYNATGGIEDDPRLP